MKHLLIAVLLFAPLLTFADTHYDRHHHNYHRHSVSINGTSQPDQHPAQSPTPQPPVQTPVAVTQTPPPISSEPSGASVIGVVLPATSNPLTTIPATLSGLNCINYGYSAQDNPSVDIPQMRSKGINCVRLQYANTWNSNLAKKVQAFKGEHFFVQIGKDTFSSDFGTYDVNTLAMATAAQQNGVDMFGVGNEAEYNCSDCHTKGITQAQVQQHMAQLAKQVKTVYSGIVGYSTFKSSQYDAPKVWAANMGGVDVFQDNCYADCANTAAELQSLLPNRWNFSEYNVDCDYGQCDNDTTWLQGIQRLSAIADKYHVMRSWFAYRCDGSSCPAHWTMINHGLGVI